MSHSNLRDLALTGKTEELMAIAEELVAHDPDRKFARDSLEIVATLSKGNYLAAEALIETAKFHYSGTAAAAYIDQVSAYFGCYIDFAFGRFNQVRSKAEKALALKPELESIEDVDKLAIYKILADTAFMLDDFDELENIMVAANKVPISGDRNQALYYLNTIECFVEFQRGDFIKAFSLAQFAIELGNKFGYVGFGGSLTAQNILYRCLIAMAKYDEATKASIAIIDAAEKANYWPWYFVTKGSFIKRLAQENKMKEALSEIREMRDKISDFTFHNQLDIFPDAAELYVRFLLQDKERISVLMSRLPNLLIVQQIKSYQQTSNSDETSLKIIQKLPETNVREKLYKIIAHVEFYKEHESKALVYTRQAFDLVEKYGYTQFLLLQPHLYDLYFKAAKIKPTAFIEDFTRRLTQHISEREIQSHGGLVDHLTKRELEVIQHLATGKPISQIAATLHVSMNTMKTHLRNTYRKLSVDGRHSAVTKARELFLI